jgi:predicted transcriptional regulator
MKKTMNKKSCVLTAMVKNNLDLLNRHIIMLKALQKRQPLGISELSEITGYPQHNIRYSLQILEQEGLIEPSIQGAVTTENIDGIIIRLKNSIRDVSTGYTNLLKKLE